MKKIFALALAIIICLSIAACDMFRGDDDDTVSTTADTTEVTTTEATTTEAETTTTANTNEFVEPDDERDPAVDDIF